MQVTSGDNIEEIDEDNESERKKIRTIRTSTEIEKVTDVYLKRAKNMKTSEIEELLRNRFFKDACKSLGVKSNDIVPTTKIYDNNKYHKFRDKKKIRNVLLRMERSRKSELLALCLVRSQELRDSERDKEKSNKNWNSSETENNNTKSPYMIDDALEEEIARRRRKKQIELKAKRRLARAKEKREKMHAVVRRSHNMRLKEIEEKRAAHERLKEDIVFTRKKSNFRSLRRAQNQIEREKERDAKRRLDIQHLLNERFEKIEMSPQEKQEELSKIRSQYWI